MAKVFSVNPVVSPGGRSVQIKVRTTGDIGALKDGLYVNCKIILKEKENIIKLPYKALIYRNQDCYTYKVDPQTSIVTKKKLTRGIEDTTGVEIQTGVKAGDLLITEGRNIVVDGCKVKIVQGQE